MVGTSTEVDEAFAEMVRQRPYCRCLQLGTVSAIILLTSLASSPTLPT